MLSNRDPGSFLVLILLAVICIGIGVVTYQSADIAERHGGGWTTHWIVGIVYDLGGKVAAALVFVVPGVVLALLAIRRLIFDGGPFQRLGARQRNVLQLIAEGNTPGQIARKLEMDVEAVEAERAAIMKKLDIHEHQRLIEYALRTGLVRSPR